MEAGHVYRQRETARQRCALWVMFFDPGQEYGSGAREAGSLTEDMDLM